MSDSEDQLKVEEAILNFMGWVMRIFACVFAVLIFSAIGCSNDNKPMNVGKLSYLCLEDGGYIRTYKYEIDGKQYLVFMCGGNISVVEHNVDPVRK
jgi:hypothetical protein